MWPRGEVERTVKKGHERKKSVNQQEKDMSIVQQPLLTVADFERIPDPPDGSKLELVRGEIIAMPPPKGKHGICCQRIGRFLGNHVDPLQARLGYYQ